MPKIVTKLALAVLACGVLFAVPIRCQNGTPGAPQQQQSGQLSEQGANALRTLAGQLNDKRKQRDAAIAQNDQVATARLDGEIQALHWQFAELMTQIDVKKLEAPGEQKLDLLADALEALRPVVDLLNELTEDARRELELKKAIEAGKRQLEIAEEGRNKVQATIFQLGQLPTSDANTIAIKEANLELREHWVPRIARLNNQLLVLEESKTQLLASKSGWFDAVKGNANAIWQSTVSIFLCAAVFLLVFFVLRLVSGLIVGKKKERKFQRRLAEILLRIITLVLAIAATMLVPYARGDHMMLVIFVLVVVGIGWVIIKSAPQYAEQIRLILNIGSVREGERIIIDGLPFRVDRLRFYSKLSNPALTGGALRVPIGQLIGERSRAPGPEEPWFPCQQGDVVAMEGDMVGRIQLQTPEVVVFVERHDAPRSYPTAAFLDLNPRNLSNGFEINILFGIDYSHQDIAVDKAPALMQADLEAGLAEDPDSAAIKNVRVELAAAGSSSLDLQVEIQLSGEAAIRYHNLQRLVNRLLVQSCTKHSLGIPFPQVQVHGVTPANAKP